MKKWVKKYHPCLVKATCKKMTLKTVSVLILQRYLSLLSLKDLLLLFDFFNKSKSLREILIKDNRRCNFKAEFNFLLKFLFYVEKDNFANFI